MTIVKEEKIDETINVSEGTNFNKDFIYRVIGTVYDDVSSLGDMTDILYNKRRHVRYNGVVPSVLCDYFKFKAFIESINATMNLKCSDAKMVDIATLIEPFFKTDDHENIDDRIRKICLFFNTAKLSHK